MSDILSFSGDFRFLSNFYESVFTDVRSNKWFSVEQYFQAHKCSCREDYERFVPYVTPREAKRLGRNIKCRSDWDALRLRVMKRGVSYKFWQNVRLRNLLLDTGDVLLVEGNTWGDCFWGVCRGKGENHLGRILMALRSDYLRLEARGYPIRDDLYNLSTKEKSVEGFIAQRAKQKADRSC